MSDNEANESDIPMKKFDLYIKASAIDKETKGSCPICQQFFMITCLLGESQDDIDFKVYTVQAECPPKYFAAGWSKKYPVVMVKSGRNKKNVDISGLMYDTFEELEDFFDGIINDDNKVLKRNNTPNQTAMKVVQNVYKMFNHFIASDPEKNPQPEKSLKVELKKLNEFLESQDSMFLVDDVLAFADCHLLPRLQHIRVAGKAFHNFEIPKEYSYVWRYLKRAYSQDAFKSTMPSDQDIIFHYQKKATRQPRINGKLLGNPTLASFTYTMEVPDEFLQSLDNDDKEEDEQQVVESNNAVADVVREQQQLEQEEEPEQEVEAVAVEAAPVEEPTESTETNGAPEENGSIGSGSTNEAPADEVLAE